MSESRKLQQSDSGNLSNDSPISNAYFLTMGVKNGDFLFGSVVNEEVQLNFVGKMICSEWKKLPEEFSGLQLDEFIVMPNHFHAVILFEDQSARDDPLFHAHPLTVAEVVAVFKANTKKAYLADVEEMGWSMFHFRLWERSYFDRPLRTKGELAYARKYILENPKHWHRDWENPDWLEGKSWNFK